MIARLRRLEARMVEVLPVSREFLRFGLVGTTGLVVNQVVLLAATTAGLAVPVASALASEVAVVNNYVLNDRWSFDGDRLSWRRLAMFNATALVGIAITAGVVTALSALTPLPLVVANLFAVGAATGWNFLASAKWTFRGRARHSGDLDPTTTPPASDHRCPDDATSHGPAVADPAQT